MWHRLADTPKAVHKLVGGGAQFHGEDADFCYSMLLVVRAAEPARTSPLCFKLSTNSYFAYNNWGGHSLYGFHSLASWGGDSVDPAPTKTTTGTTEKDYTTQMIEGGGRQSHRVSPYRPGHGYYGSIEGRFLTWERLFLLWAVSENVVRKFWPAPDSLFELAYVVFLSLLFAVHGCT
eukprot:SAG31_NODE_2705_length_5215_cov_9.452502_6_plen_177_part_00